jgi:serine beta-lactamase-like protein LACTB
VRLGLRLDRTPRRRIISVFFRSVLLGIAFAMVTATSSVAQRPEGADVWHVWTEKNAPMGDSIRSIVEAVAARQGNVGLAVAVWHRGELVFAAGQGLADVECGAPVTRDTRFQVASVTKPFTGMVLLRLFERGQIDLDAPIQRYVPHFPARSGAPITLRYLQAHLGGVRGYRPNERTPDFLVRHHERATDAIEIFMNDSLAAAGSQPIYSSYGYNLIAAAIEGATGKPFPGVLAAEILRPLSLQKTMTPDARVPIRHRAKSYTYVAPDKPGSETETLFRGREHDFSYNHGGGNLLTTVEDLARFGRALFDPEFLRDSTRRRLRTPLNAKAIQNFGWVVTKDEQGRPILFTTGDIEAFQAGVTVWPEEELVVALTSNTQGKGSGRAELRRDVPQRIGLRVLERR